MRNWWWWGVGIGLMALGGSAAAQTKLAAQQFAFRSTGGNAGNDYNIWSNGFIGTFVNLKNPATVMLQIQAAGQAAKRIWPVMGIHVGNQTSTVKVGQAGFATYAVTANLPAGTTLVRIEFRNDFYDSVLNQDRNLIVRDLSVTAPAAAGLTIVNPGTPLALQDAVFSAADSTIENYRKQDGQVTVVDSAGKPLANASVRLRLTKHAFNFGTAVAGVGEGNALMWPNPAAGSSAAAYQAALAANFNMVSPENTGKWAFSEAVRGVPTLSYLDAIYNFAAANKMRARFHTLLWGESQPEWVLALEKTAQGSDSKAAAAALASLKDAIQARTVYLAKDRGKKFIEMDGINEASAGHQPVFLNLFGYAGVAEIYRNAIIQLRASSSSARLYFNDYNILNYGPDNFGSWYVNFIRGVVDAGLTTADQTKLGVGIQYYNIGGIQHDPVRVYQTLANLGTLGLPISLTEFGVDSGQPGPAATILADTVRLVFGTDQATTFNTWGFWTPAMWVSGAAFYDANWNLTPVGKVWQQMTGLKNWNLAGVPSWTTDVTLTTTAAGTLNLRGFMGDYTVTTGRLSGALALKSGVAAYTVKVRR